MRVTEASFEECFHEHYARLVALGVSMTGDHGVARDCAQETFIRAHDRWESVSAYDRPGAWLRRVMSNLLIDHHRSRSAELRAVDRLDATTVRTAESPDQPGDEWDALVADLPARQRLIVTLFYGHDQSIADIADVLGVSPNTVKSSLSKARTTLRRTLEARHEH